MLAPTTSSPCRPWEPGSAVCREDSATPAALLQDKGKDILHGDVIMVTPDAPSQSPPPQVIVDVAIAGLSHSSLAEHTGEYPPRPPRDQHDIV